MTIRDKSHLIILIHGVNGYTTDLNFLKSKIEKADTNAQVIIPKCNQGKTHDGVEKGALRYLDFIQKYIKNNTITEISIIGHSFGGLYARFLAKLLVDFNIIPKIKPRFLMALSTPHLPPRQHDWLFGRFTTKCLLKLLLGKSGSDLWKETGILYEMTLDSYLEPLKLFEKLIVYANIKYDPVVDYSNANICKNNYQYCKYNKNRPLVFEHDEPLEVFSNVDDLDPEQLMLQRLMSVGWTRFAILPSRPLVAHVDMIVKSKFFSKKHGESICKHIASHFQKPLVCDSFETLNNLL
jgi:hypothetical protein